MIFSMILALFLVLLTTAFGLIACAMLITLITDKDKLMFFWAFLASLAAFLLFFNLFSEPAIVTTTTINSSMIETSETTYKGTVSNIALDTSTGSIYSISADNLLRLKSCKSTTGLGVYTTQSWKWGPITLKNYDPTNQLQITCN